MFEFGKEEPITNNESLVEKSNGLDQLCIDRSKGRELNRYSFLYKGEASNSISLVLREVMNHTRLKTMAIACWPINIPSKSLVATKMIEKKYIKAHWEVSVRQDHYLAIKEVYINELNSWPPHEIKNTEVGMLLLLSNEPNNSLFNALNEECSSFLARMRYFVPNNEFFSKLEENDISAAYQVNDQLNNSGLVFLGKHAINETLLSKIKIAHTYEGKSAFKVFT